MRPVNPRHKSAFRGGREADTIPGFVCSVPPHAPALITATIESRQRPVGRAVWMRLLPASWHTYWGGSLRRSVAPNVGDKTKCTPLWHGPCRPAGAAAFAALPPRRCSAASPRLRPPATLPPRCTCRLCNEQAVAPDLAAWSNTVSTQAVRQAGITKCLVAGSWELGSAPLGTG